MSERLLTFDTSSSFGGLAISQGETLLGELLLESPATHSDYLLECARDLLGRTGCALEEIDAFAVVAGPGAFTGLRVGIGTVKGLALGTGKPVLGVSSLQAVAAQFPFARLPVSVLLDARKKEVYACTYRWSAEGPEPQGPERVCPPEAVLGAAHEETLFAGSGALLYRELIVRRLGDRAHFAPWPLHKPRPGAAALLALAALRRGEAVAAEQLLPRYLRLSEAEIQRARSLEEGGIQG